MIITLPNNFKAAVFDINIPESEPMFKLTLVKGGVLFYNTSGVLIGQVFYEGNAATAVIADGASIRVERSDNNYIIAPPSAKNADKKNLQRPESERILLSEFSIFGRPSQHNYQLFEKKTGTTKPSIIATIIPVPLEDKIRIKVDDGSNLLRIISLVVAINLL